MLYSAIQNNMENTEYRITFKKVTEEGEEIMLQKTLNQEEFDAAVKFYLSIKSPKE